VIQAACDLGLEQEAGATDRIVGMLVEDLLERHLAMQLAVESDIDGSKPASRVGPQHAESLTV
jgi:hypothetical protein